MKILHLTMVAVLISLLVLTGCSNPAVQKTPVSGAYTDDAGRTVEIKTIPQRIISLTPSNTEMVYALGLQDSLAGVTSADNYPPDVKNKPVVSEYGTVNLETVVNAKPDLVLADSIYKKDAVPALEKLGITVFIMSPDSMDGIIGDLKTLGRMTGKTKEADALIASLSARIKAVADKTAKLTDAQKPRVLMVTWCDPFWTAGSDTMMQYLITAAGGTNIFADLNGYAEFNLEAAIERNPQIIIVMSTMGTGNSSMDFIKSSDKFKATDALKNGQVYEIDTDIFGRTTPRIVDGLETLAKIAHPELFK